MKICWHKYILEEAKEEEEKFRFRCLKFGKTVNGSKGVLGIFYYGVAI